MAEAAAAIGLGASIVQLILLGNSIGKRLKKYHSKARDLPKAIHHISVQLPILTLSLSRVKDHVDANGDGEQERSMVTAAVDAYLGDILELDAILTKLIPEPGDSAWKRRSKALQSLAQDNQINQINSRLQGAVSTLMLCLVSRQAPAVQQHEVGTITIIEDSAEASARAPANSDEVTQAISSNAQQHEIGTVIILEDSADASKDAAANRGELTRATSSNDQQMVLRSESTHISDEHERPSHLDLDIDTSRPIMTIQNSGCDSWCTCSCHLQKALRSPAALERVLGNLQLSFSGLYWLQKCDTDSCEGKAQPSRVHGTYVAPPWLIQGAVTFFLQSQALGGKLVGLQPARFVDPCADIMRHARDGSLPGIQWLFSRGLASPFDVDNGGLNALALASHEGHVECCKFLVQQGADPDYKSTDGRSPRDRAINRVQRIVLGLSRGSLQEALDQSNTPIEIDREFLGDSLVTWAIWRGDLSATRTLLENGADPKMLALEASWSPVTGPVMTEVLRLVLKAGALTDNLDTVMGYHNVSRTVLHSACLRARSPDFIRTLLEAGASVDARDEHGAQAIHCLHKYDETTGQEVIALLVRWGADPNSRTISQTRLVVNETPLHSLCRLGYGSRALHGLACTLIEHGTDPLLMASHEMLPVYWAIVHGRRALQTYLLLYMFNSTRFRDMPEYHSILTYIFSALLYYGQVPVLRSVLPATPHLVFSSDGSTLLHCLALHADLEMLALFKPSWLTGIDPDQRMRGRVQDWTPAEFLRMCRRPIHFIEAFEDFLDEIRALRAAAHSHADERPQSLDSSYDTDGTDEEDFQDAREA